MIKKITILMALFFSVSTFAQEFLPCKGQVRTFIFDICDYECKITKLELTSSNSYDVEYSFYGVEGVISKTILFDEKTCEPRLK